MGQDDRRAVGEFSDKGQIAAHTLDGLAKCGQQKIAPPFEAGNSVLGDSERFGHADLRELPATRRCCRKQSRDRTEGSAA